jgi:fatty-acyl-CoA synthase
MDAGPHRKAAQHFVGPHRSDWVVMSVALSRIAPTAARHTHYAVRILDALERDPARTVVHFPGGTITAGTLGRSIMDAAAALRDAGVDATSVVAILTAPNHPLMLSVRYAAHLLGAAVVHIRSMNPRSDADTFPLATQAEIVRATGVRVLVVDEANAERGQALADAAAGLTVVGHIDRSDGATPEFAPYAPSKPAVIDFTSGSTNKPKMVRQLFGTRERLVSLLSGNPQHQRPATLLSVTPISHTTAPMADAVLADGGTVVLHHGFDAGDVVGAVGEHHVTDVYLAVPHLYRLIDHPGISDANLWPLRRVIYSGTPAAPSRVARAVEIFGDALIQVYGTTEAGGITSLTPADHREPELLATVGRPFPWVQLEIRDPRSSAEVERGQIGEVWVRSPTVMDGYLGEPALTDRVLRHGWLRTGDLGHWDRYGYLRLVGRVGNVIKRGGLKLDPVAIERTLLAHPQVKNATVYGVRDGDYIEQVHAAVELRDGAVCTTGELRAHVASTLSPIHAPADITMWDELPLTAPGKPDHAFLRTRKGTP